MQVGSFGSITFEVSEDYVLTPATVKRENKARYEEHKVLCAKPRLEFLSPELQTFSLSIQLSLCHGVDPFDTLLSIKAYIVDGIAERLILGGINYGYHIIESCSEDWGRSKRNGSLMTARATLAFKEYVK